VKRHPKGATPTAFSREDYMTATKTLINFHVPTDLLATFDRLCRLHGKPRSQILNDLLHSWIIKSGKQVLSRIDEVRKIDQHLQSACEKPVSMNLADLLPEAGNAVHETLKRKFSDF